MLYREFSDFLLKWKNKKDHKPLVVRGARQVGKTFIIDDFGRKNYKNYIYINFEKEPEYASIFDGSLDIDTLIQKLRIQNKEWQFVPNETLIFFDEIQKGKNCRTALKFFAIDKRYDIIASGSLLGLHHEQVSSFPVGYVENVELFGLNFKEFCMSQSVTKDLLDKLEDSFKNKQPIDDFYHNYFLDLFKKYIVIGGMPEAINTFNITNDYVEVNNKKKYKQALYKDDVAKYAHKTEVEKILECFDSIPRHLSKDHKKFKYSEVNKNGSSRKYQGSLYWLYDAGIISYCYNLTKVESPFEGFVKENDFKIYMRDTGLLVAMLGDDTVKQILEDKLEVYKGAIYENIIGDILVKSGKKLYYYEKNNRSEIDFIIRYDNKDTLLEVKSSENTKAKSVKFMIDNNMADYAIKLSTKNIYENGKILNLPIYMAMFL